MFLKKYTPLFILFLQLSVFAQENLSVSGIPDNLKEHANAVVRLSKTDVVIDSRKSMTITSKKIVTVFNETGFDDVDTYEYFDETRKIKSIEAVIYNAFGAEVKKIRKKDFKMSAVSQGAGITDTKALYLSYTPVQYPFTIVFESEVQTANTAFITPWMPVSDLYMSVEKSEFNIQYSPELGFRYKEYNFDDITLKKEESEGVLKLSCENVPAIKSEEYSPYKKIMPKVMFSLTKFHLEGVDGEASDWASFGNWYYNTLLTGTDEVPAETVTKVKTLIGDETDPIKKARIVYKYVQDKTRYVSIQLGIGGWKPMLAKDVDRLGYGDCKALSNYTRSLLKAVGVDSYCAIIYGDRRKRDISDDFVCMQGNHMVLAIPNNNELVWLECTSQIAPFGFQGDFTDDRMALIITPEKGELVRTHVYKKEENTQYVKGSYNLLDNGKITGELTRVSNGTQYDDKYMYETSSKDDLDKLYKSRYFNNINNLKLNKTEFNNNREKPELTETIELEAESYGSISGNRMMFVINAFNMSNYVPQRYRNRHNPFEIERGFLDSDEIVITLPAGYTIEALPGAVEIKEKFGEYTAVLEQKDDNTLIYKRTFSLNRGLYEKSDYDLYRQFREKIAKNDNAKAVLLKK